MSSEAVYAIYQQHLRQGRLAYQYSRSAQRPVFYPRAMSPYDVHEELEWRLSEGRGVVYSTTVIASKEGRGYNVALIDCDEGFRLMSRVERCEPDDVFIGMRVQFEVHTPVEGDPFPIFVPAKDRP